MRLEYVGLRVTDLERSVRFYTELLGLEEIRRRDSPNSGGTWVVLKDPESGAKLELNWYPEGSEWDAPYVPGEGLDHIGFIVDDVREAYERLVAAGAEPAMDPSRAEGWVAYVKDPDGNWVEIYQLTQPNPQ